MAILFHGIRCLAMSLALFPPAFSLIVHGFDELYGPPPVDEPALPYSCGVMGRLGNLGLSNGGVRDDAGRWCLPSELSHVELRADPGIDAQGGHVFIKTPTLAVGFRTKLDVVEKLDYLNPLAAPVEGVILDDAHRPYSRLLRFRASPKTIQVLEASIKAHASDPYQLGNWQGGRNCATWATDRLGDAGFTPPPGDCPNRLAWYLQPSPASAVRTSTTFGRSASLP